MAVLFTPDVGARSGWMRQALLVTVLAGEPGASQDVPGPVLWKTRAGLPPP